MPDNLDEGKIKQPPRTICHPRGSVTFGNTADEKGPDKKTAVDDVQIHGHVGKVYMALRKDGSYLESVPFKSEEIIRGVQVGTEGQGGSGPNDITDPPTRKMIRVEEGNIYLNAPQGAIILDAKNIIFTATGASSNNGGYIVARANDAFVVDAQRSVSIKSQTVRIVGIKELDMGSKMSTRIFGGVSYVAKSDALIDIVSNLSKILNFVPG